MQTVKRTLRKAISKPNLTCEELLTILSEAECVINSQPLCYQCSDEVIETTAPSHLIYGRRILSHPSNSNSSDENTETLSSGVKHINNIFNHYSKRWSHEYLMGLREYQIVTINLLVIK